MKSNVKAFVNSGSGRINSNQLNGLKFYIVNILKKSPSYYGMHLNEDLIIIVIICMKNCDPLYYKKISTMFIRIIDIHI